MRKLSFILILILVLCLSCTLLACGTDTSSTSETCTITFDSNGGSEVASTVLNVGDGLTLPTDPTKAGYDFLGWYYDAECTQTVRAYLFSASKDLTLYAGWIDSMLCSHTLTAGECDNGYIKVSVSEASFNETIRVYTYADAGYQLVEGSIAVNGVYIEGTSFLMPAEAVVVTAEFELSECEIIVMDSDNGTIICSTTTANMGDEITISVQPEVGYYLSSISTLDATVTIANNTFTMGSNDLYIMCEFSKIDYEEEVCSVNIEVDGEGSVTPSKNYYALGEYIVLDIVADSGYMLESVVVNGFEVSDLIIAYTEETTIEVRFVAIDDSDIYNIDIIDAEGGSVTTLYESVAAGSVVELGITTESDYIFKGFMINGSVVSAANSFVMPNYDCEITAIFVRVYDIEVETYGGGYIDVDYTKAEENSYIYVWITAYDGYTYIEGSLQANGAQVELGSYILVTSDMYLTAEFAEDASSGSYTISTQNTAGAAIILSATSADSGEYVSITAVADEGYRITSITANGLDITYGFVMPSENVTIMYTVEVVYGITIAESSNGVVVADKEVASYGEEVTFTIIPTSGYYLTTLTINGKIVINAATTRSTYTYTMGKSDLAVDAAFWTPISYTSSYKITVIENDNCTISVASTAYGTASVEVVLELEDGYVLNDLYYISAETGETVSISEVFSMPNCAIEIGVVVSYAGDEVDLRAVFDDNIYLLNNIGYTIGYSSYMTDITAMLSEVGAANYAKYVDEYVEIEGIKKLIAISCTDTEAINAIASLFYSYGKYSEYTIDVVGQLIVISSERDSASEWYQVIKNGLSYSNNYTYYVREDGSTGLFDYNGGGGVIVIPEYFNGRAVTYLDHAVFEGERDIITAVYISNLRELDGYALANMSALTWLDLTGITYMESTSIYNNQNITAYYIYGTSGTYSTDNYGVVYDASDSSLFAYPVASIYTTYTIKSGIEKIGSYAFYNSTIKEIITSNVTLITVGEYAFYCAKSLTTVEVKQVIDVGKYAFYGTDNLSSITFSRLGTVGENAFSVGSGNLTLYLTSSDTVCEGQPIVFVGGGNLCIYVSMSKIDTFRQSDNWGQYSKYLTITTTAVTGTPCVIYYETYGGTYINCVITTTLSTITAPADPEKEGYTFMGWYTDETFETEYEFGSKLSGYAIRIYALFE